MFQHSEILLFTFYFLLSICKLLLYENSLTINFFRVENRFIFTAQKCDDRWKNKIKQNRCKINTFLTVCSEFEIVRAVILICCRRGIFKSV